jgi:hypothetical protein
VLDPAQRPNQNPVIFELHARDGADAGAGPLEPGPPRRIRAIGDASRSAIAEHRRPARAAPASARREVRLGGRLIIAPVGAEAETYAAMTYDREAGRLVLLPGIKETLRFAFFASRGSFSPAQVNTEPDVLRTNPKVVMESTYEAPKTLPPGADRDVDIWVVVRDERAGQSFAHARVRLVP